MSITEQAKSEMELAGITGMDAHAMLTILGIFFTQWDSGGAVHAMAPVLQRLIAGKPLSPLSGADSEWIEQGPDVFQNKRCGSVFKERDVNGNWITYDIDRPPNPGVPADAVMRHRWAPCEITFPYWTDKAEVESPEMVIATKDSIAPEQ